MAEPSRLDLLLEAERRGLAISMEDRALLTEGRARGFVPPSAASLDLAQQRESVITNPPGLTDYIISTIRTEALPIIGMLGGGALGVASPMPGGAAVGGVLGFAGGRQANRLLEEVARFFLPPERQARPAGGALETAGEIGKDLVTGAALEAAGPAMIGLGRGVRALAETPLGIRRASPADLDVRAAAERLGIPLTAGTKSGSASVARIESIPGQFPIGRQASEPTETAIRGAAERAAGRLAEPFGPAKTLEQAGASIQREVGAVARAQENAPTAVIDQFLDTIGTSKMPREALGGSLKEAGAAAEKARRASASALYDEALALGGAESQVPLSQTAQVATRMVQFESKMQGVRSPVAGRAEGLAAMTAPPKISPSDLSAEAAADLIRGGGKEIARAVEAGTPLSVQDLPREFIERYGLATSGSRTLEETLSVQQRLRALVRNTTDDFTRSQLRRLLDGVTADVATFGQHSGGMVGAKLVEASRFYRQEVAEFFARKAPVRRLFDRNPSAVADQVLATKSPELIRDTLRVLPERQQDELRRGVLERLKQRSLDVRTGEVNPAKFEAEIARAGEDILGELLGPRMRELNGVRKTLAKNFGRDTTDQALAQTLTAQPEQIVRTFTVGRVKSLEDFDAVFRAVSPTTRQEMRSAMLSDLVKHSADPHIGLFSIDRFMVQKNNIPQDIWDRLLTDNAGAALNDVQLVFRRIATFNKIAANPSQTGMTLLGTGQILQAIGAGGILGSTLMGREDPQSFSLKVLGLLSPLALGKIVFSKMGQRALTSMPARPINPQGSAATIPKIIGSQMVTAEEPR